MHNVINKKKCLNVKIDKNVLILRKNCFLTIAQWCVVHWGLSDQIGAKNE